MTLTTPNGVYILDVSTQGLLLVVLVAALIALGLIGSSR